MVIQIPILSSAYEVLKKEIEDGKIWTKESVIKLYDQVCEEVNGTFKKFMGDAFIVQPKV